MRANRLETGGTRSPESGRRLAVFARGTGLVLLAAVLGAGAVARLAHGAPPSMPLAVGAGGWVDVDYGRLVDRQELTHSSDSVGRLLQALGGRPYPPPGERPEDAAAHRLLEPILEPYAFVLPDVLDSLEAAHDPPFVEVGDLWRPGEAQPAWAEILRSRRYVVESDGLGRFRACVPYTPRAAGGGAAPAGEAEISSERAGNEAWEDAWPVLRHVLAAEQRRLARKAGDSPAAHKLDVEVHAYLHSPERTSFRVGLVPHRVRVQSTAAHLARPPLDLAAWEAFLERGLEIRGGLLEPDGSLRLLGTPATPAPGLLGRPATLADFAVAHRAVFHGGRVSAYMSLDRGDAPHVAKVNFGGRLQDTSLGLVSLKSDIRFKTFSVGIDVTEGKDAREALRRALPSFRTHWERFGSDPRSAEWMGQQTRLWFYPDDVNVSLSEEGDALVMRRTRMTAASERMEGFTASAAAAEDPPWTQETIAAINRDYDALARVLPELRDLDQVARLLTMFTWLKQAEAEGRALPDLDALLDTTLPDLPTPKRFPQLLAYNALPPAGSQAEVDVIDRTPVEEALERLRPTDGMALPPLRRFRRAVAALGRHPPGQEKLLDELNALADELGAIDVSKLDGADLDVLSYRAERAVLKRLVLRTLPAPIGARLKAKETALGGLRAFSVAIGGVELGMEQALARAARRGRPTGPGGAPREQGTRAAAASVSASGASPAASETSAAGPVLPDHGAGADAVRQYTREVGGSTIRKAFLGTAPVPRPWFQVVMGADGPDARSRLVVLHPDGRAQTFERVDGSRFLRYVLDPQGGGLVARPVAEPPLPASVVAPRPADAPIAALPAALSILDLVPAAAGGAGEAPAIRLRIRYSGRPPVQADVPRPVLQRLVLGREVDLAVGQPLPGLGQPGQMLGGATTLMAMALPSETLPFWSGLREPIPGDEDPVKIGTALGRWWASDPAPAGAAPRVVIGTGGARSVERWQKAPTAVRQAVLLLPEDAFPGPFATLRAAFAAAWGADRTLATLGSGRAGDLVALVSAEPPALLGARLRALARDPAMKGKLLVVWPLGGPVRTDLPASLLDEGNLAGIGLAEWSPVGLGRTVEEAARLAKACAGRAAGEARGEALAPFLAWYF